MNSDLALDERESTALATGTFDRTTAINWVGPGRYAAHFHPAWASLRGVHGGSIAAIAVRAAEAELEGKLVRTISVGFLRAGQVGGAEVVVTPVRVGRLVSVVEVAVTQAHGEVARVRVTALDPTEGTAWGGVESIELPAIDDCPPVDPPGDIRHFDHCDARLDPAGIPFTHQTTARIAGYVRPREPHALDAPFLAMLLDWFPPAAFVRVDPPTGGVSVDYTVHLHRTWPTLDDGEWLRGRFEVRHSAAGLGLEQGLITSPDGTVLAETFHTRLAM